MLFQMIQGRPPYDADSLMDVLLGHLAEPLPELTSPYGPVPDAVAQVVRKATAKTVAMRYQSAGEIEQDLQKAASTLGAEAPCVSDTTKDALPTVLVVDDDPWILELVKDMLAAEPCRVVTTTEPVKALPLMEWERADVLVADIAMPEVDGIDLVVRARKLFPAVPRILLTAAPTLERVIRSVNEAEIYRVLVKPVSPKVLRETIREALQHRLEPGGGGKRTQRLPGARASGSWPSPAPIPASVPWSCGRALRARGGADPRAGGALPGHSLRGPAAGAYRRHHAAELTEGFRPRFSPSPRRSPRAPGSWRR